MNAFNLKEHELTVEEVFRNLPPSALYEHAILYEKDAHIAENGALVAYSGVKTGRSPKDKRVVKQSPSKDNVWWGPVNIALEPQTFAINRERARDYLNSRERLYCFDGFAGWDSKYRIKVRVICSRPYHALFMHAMLSKYAELLAAKMKQHGTRVWLVNTGWSGGAYGTGKRIKLAHTRAIVDAIHSGTLAKAETRRDPVFGLNVVTECPNVPSEILVPRNVWSDEAAYEATAKKLGALFTKNFATYEAGVSAEVKSAGPAA
jgi:ATP-dependent phosphoenolpyruvate carboxykinase